MSDSSNNFKQKILNCLDSAEEFKANSRHVREELMKQNKETITVFLDTVQQVLAQKIASPEARFYALFFLKLTTEHHNPQLLSQLAMRKELFRTLEEQAAFDKDKEFPLRGSTFFSATPTDKEKSSGSNYLALLLEVIKYWNQKYGSTDKSWSNPFALMFRSLAEDQMVSFPKAFHFYKSKDQKAGESYVEKPSKGSDETNPQQQFKTQQQEKKPTTISSQQQQSQLNQQSQQQKLQTQQQQQSQVQQAEKQQIQPRGQGDSQKDSTKNTQQRQLQEDRTQTPTPQPKTDAERAGKNYNVQESDDVKNAKQKISTLKMAFQGLQEVYNYNKVESAEIESTLPLYYENLAEIHKPFAEIITVLLTSQDQQNEEILAEIFPLSGHAADLELNFQQYKDKKIKYQEHRLNALNLIQGSETTPFETYGKEETPIEKHSPVTQNPNASEKSTSSMSKTNTNSNKTGSVRPVEKMQYKSGNLLEEHEDIPIGRQSENQKKVEVSHLKQKPVKADSEPQKEIEDVESYVNPIEKRVSQEPMKQDVLLSSKTNDPHGTSSSKFAVSHTFKNKFQENKMASPNTETSELRSSGPSLSHQQQIATENKPSELKNEQELQKQNVPKSSKFQREDPPKVKNKTDSYLGKEEIKIQELAEEPRSRQIEETKVLESKAKETAISQGRSAAQRRPIWEDSSSTKIEAKNDPYMPNILSNEPKKPLQLQQKETFSSKGQSSVTKETENWNKVGEEEKERAKAFNAKFSAIEVAKQGNTLKSQKNPDEEEEKHPRFMMQSLNPRLPGPNGDADTSNRQNMAQSMKLSHVANSLRFSGDLKLMARALKNTRDRSSDLQKIHEGIKRSFAVSKKKLPPALQEHNLADPVVLSKFEQDLHLLKQENEMLRSTSNVHATSNGSQDHTLKLLVTDLQKQIGDFQREIEHLKKKNDTLERTRGTVDESTNEGISNKLHLLELENRTLQRKIEEVSTAKKLPEESKTLQDRIRELSDENEWLTGAMNNIKRDNLSLNSKLVDLEDVQGAHPRLRLGNSSDINRDEERLAGNKATSKTELRNSKVSSNFESPKPFLQSTMISPKGGNFAEQQYRSPDHELFWHGMSHQLSPIEPQKNFLKDQGRSDQQGTFLPESGYHHVRESAENTNHTSWRKDFVSPRTQNVEIGKRHENRFEKGPTNSRGGNVIRYHQNSSPEMSDPNERYETPDEDTSGVEDYRTGQKRHVPVKTHVYQGESGINFGRGGTKGGDRQAHHIFSSHKAANEDENENNNQEINFWESVDNKKSAESEWNQAIQKKKNGRAGDADQRNPFESESEWSEELKGITVPASLYIFEELNSRLLSTPTENSVFYFKMACLKSKCPIYEDDFVQIGATSSVIQDYSTGKHQLKLGLFFSNKTDETITNFTTSLTEGLNLEVVMKPENLEPTITTNKQAKQTILVSFKTIPISCLQMNCRAVCAGQKLSFNVFLPTMMNKFMEFKYVDAEEFRSRWRTHSSNTLKSESIQIDSSIVRNAYDFKKYFAYLIDLKPDDEYDFIHGKKSIKLGGVFELKEPGSEYSLKINFLPSQEVVFQIATPSKNTENAKFVMQNLIFLFKK